MSVRIYQAFKPDGSVLWPEVRSKEWLEEKRRKMLPSIFNSQYMNDPSGLRGVMLDVEWLQYYSKTSLPPLEQLIGYQTGDPATSDSQTSNWFGHCTAGHDPDTGLIYVLAMAFGHITAPDHLEFLRGHYDSWQQRNLTINEVILESIGPQQGTVQQLQNQARLDPRGPMPLTVMTPKGSKEIRYRAMTPYLQSGHVLFPGEYTPNGVTLSQEKGFKEFLTEYSSFPRGGRDDLLDALWMMVDRLVTTVGAAAMSQSAATDPEVIKAELEEEARLSGVQDVDSYVKEELRKQREEQYERDREDAISGLNSPRERMIARTGRQSLFR